MANRILLKDFGSHAHEVSERVKRAALRSIEEAGRRIQYLPSSKDDKEEIARGIAEQEHITQGPVCALTCVGPCIGFDIHRNRESKQLELVQRPRKCLFVYQYWEDPVLGWMHARILFRQEIDQSDAQPLVISNDAKVLAHLSPDGKWILYNLYY